MAPRASPRKGSAPRSRGSQDRGTPAAAAPGRTWKASADPADARAAQVEERLRLLEDFLETSSIGLHWVGPDGSILWANEADHAVLGYSKEEYLGRSIREFHLDAPVIEDILARLTRGERLRNYPARLRAKDGSVRHVLIDSSGRFVDEKFVHSRCFTRDVTDLVLAQEKERSSHALLRAVLDSVTDAIFVKDTEGRALLANEAAARALHTTPTDLLGRRDDEVLPPEAAQRIRADDLRVMAEGRPVTIEETLVVQGEPRRFSTTKAPYRDGKGRVLGVVGVARDVTERERAAEALRLSQERYRRLVDASPLSIQVFAPDGACTYANEAWERLWEAPRSHLDDYNIRKDTHLAAKGVSPLIERAFAGEAVHIPPVRYDPAEIGKPAPPRWVEAFLYPVLDEGKVREVVLILENVTTRMKAEEELRAANERLLELDKMKTQLLNTASHELRTPLTPMHLQLTLLKSADFGPLTESQRKAVQVLERNTTRLTLLLQDMLDVARLQSGRMAMEKHPMDLRGTLAEAVESFEQAAVQVKVGLSLSTEGDLRVEADGQRLSQVLYNLLSNALKFTPTGGTVAVEARREAEGVVVRVRDSGAGLSAEQLTRLFQPFSQVHQADQRAFGGSGLGLFISRGIVEEHGGRIWAESEGPGKGAVFAFLLPA